MNPAPSFGRKRHRSLRSLAGRRYLIVAAAMLAATTPAAAQLRPVVINDAHLVLPGGRSVEKAAIKISSGKIAAIAPTISAGWLDRKIDGAGKTVTPGLIDCWSSLGLVTGGPAAPDANAHVTDALDRYARDEIVETLSHGVTAVFVSPPAADGVAGLGSLIRVTPLGEVAGRIIAEDFALCASVGVAGSGGAIARVRSAAALGKKFRAAKEYRESLETYDEELEEYEKKLAERAKEKEEGATEDDQEPEPEKKAGADEEENGNHDDAQAQKEGDEKKEKDEIKKPAKPPRNPEAETLLRVIDGELPLRVEAHRPEDILNVLDIAGEYSIRLTLVGATGGHLVADEIAAAKVPVILAPAVHSATFENNAFRYHKDGNAAQLAEADVNLIFSSGTRPNASRFLLDAAALAVGHGLDRNAAWAGITERAAEHFGVEKRIGRLAPGMDADLVIWSADPLVDPGAKVETVFVGGAVVYEAAEYHPFGSRP